MKACKPFLILLFMIMFFSAQLEAIKVKSDPRIEACSLVFFLAGAREYSSCRIPNYQKQIEEYFKDFRKHEIITFIQKLRQENGVSYDAVMNAAVLIKSIDKIEPVVDLEKHPEQLEHRWTKEKLLKFYALLADFIKKSKFVSFYESHSSLYENTEKSIQAQLNKFNLQKWFEKSFPDFKSDFVLIPAYINGPSCYGPGLLVDGKQKSYCILGVYQVDDNGQPIFKDSVIDVVFHEFCHSHTNPLIEKNFKQLEETGKKLFEPVKEELSSQAYGTGRTLLFESMVRACTAVFLRENFSEEAYRKSLEADEKRSFFWVPSLAKLLLELREKNISVETGFPRIISLLSDYATNIEENIRKVKNQWEEEFRIIAKKSPRIVESNIRNGDKDVSTDIDVLTITFDRKMRDKSWAILDHPQMPEIIGKISYDATCTKLSIPLKLAPGKTYILQLNSKQVIGFKDANGNQLVPTTIRFSTRERTQKENAEQKKLTPKVIKLLPENGATNVSATTSEIKIEFSEPMQSSWSLVGGGEPFPEINGKISFDQTGKILTVPVKLRANHSYWMWLNSERFQGFLSKKGVTVSPQKYEFKTGN